jgi:hypothetical protein
MVHSARGRRVSRLRGLEVTQSQSLRSWSHPPRDRETARPRYRLATRDTPPETTNAMTLALSTASGSTRSRATTTSVPATL